MEYFSAYHGVDQRGVPKPENRCLYARLREPDRGAWKNIRECSMIKKLTFAAALLAATVAERRGECQDVSSTARRRRRKVSTPACTRPARPSTRPRAPSSTALSNSSTARPTIAPGLAESWTISDDGLEYTFKLRPGVKFQTTDYFTPTRDLNADDVVFSFERQSTRPTTLEQVRPGHCLGIFRRHGLRRTASPRSRRSTT